MRAWKPALIGSILGLIIGFAGGAGAGLVDEIKPSSSAEQAAATPALTPTEVAQSTPKPSAKPSARTPNLPRTAAAHAALSGPAKTSSTCGRKGARLVRFRVLIEPGLPTTPNQFVQGILSVLCDERSWIGSGKVRFRYDPKGSLLIGLRTPQSTEKRCKQLIGLSVNYYSCAGSGEVVLNSDRWFHGSKYWPGPVDVYRQMLVNHEVGHTLGQHHRYCPRDGAYAPVMMQQSKGLSTDGRTCKPNPWPLAYEERSLRS